MTERAPKEQRRIAARGASIAAGYLAYLALDRAHGTLASALLAGGGILVSLAGIDLWVRPPEERSSRSLAVLLVGGVAASAVGLALVLR